MKTTKFNPWTQAAVSSKLNSQGFGLFDSMLRDQFAGRSLMAVHTEPAEDLNEYVEKVLECEQMFEQKLQLQQCENDRLYGQLIDPDAMKRNIQQLEEAAQMCRDVRNTVEKAWEHDLNKKELHSFVPSKPTIEIPYEQRLPFFNQMKHLYNRKTPLLDIKDLSEDLRAAEQQLAHLNQLKLC